MRFPSFALPQLPQTLYDKLFKKNWVVYAKSHFGKPEYVIEYLGRYIHPVTNYHLKAI
nr:transposase [Psychroflexus torquis]